MKKVEMEERARRISRAVRPGLFWWEDLTIVSRYLVKNEPEVLEWTWIVVDCRGQLSQ